MKTFRSFLPLLIISVAVARPAPAAEKKPAVQTGGHYQVEAVQDVAYYEGKDADPVRHRLDLYLPKGHKDFPVLLFVHGGGWTKGTGSPSRSKPGFWPATASARFRSASGK